MGKILAKEKSIVVPGEEIASGMDYLPGFGTYRDENKIIANKLGLLYIEGRAIKIIPLSGRYIPQKGDTIIARVDEIALFGWRVDTNSAYSAVLPIKEATSDFIARNADLTRYYDFGDYIITKITSVTTQKLIDVSMRGPGLMKLEEGRIIKVNTHKVPRIIGKQGSMVTMIKQYTDCRIIVGQNGVIWIRGSPEGELLAVKTIKKIEEKAHIPGLTDMIKKFLEKNKK